MSDNKEIWKKYLENLDRYLNSDDQEIISYVNNLKQQSEKLESGTLAFKDYKKIPYIDSVCQNKISYLIEKIRSDCDDLESNSITIEDFKNSFDLSLEINDQRENKKLRNQINYIKDRLIYFYWNKK